MVLQKEIQKAQSCRPQRTANISQGYFRPRQEYIIVNPTTSKDIQVDTESTQAFKWQWQYHAVATSSGRLKKGMITPVSRGKGYTKGGIDRLEWPNNNCILTHLWWLDGGLGSGAKKIAFVHYLLVPKPKPDPFRRNDTYQTTSTGWHSKANGVCRRNRTANKPLVIMIQAWFKPEAGSRLQVKLTRQAISVLISPHNALPISSRYIFSRLYQWRHAIDDQTVHPVISGWGEQKCNNRQINWLSIILKATSHAIKSIYRGLPNINFLKKCCYTRWEGQTSIRNTVLRRCFFFCEGISLQTFVW